MTKIWAHRGASSQAPENTLAAFELAVRQRADGLELDVQRTADDVLVVTHDEDCRRVTGEHGLIARLAFADLRRKNFAAFRPEASPQKIPTLAEVFDLIRPTGLTINIELKNSSNPYPGMERQVLDLVQAHGMQDRIQISSFNHESLKIAGQLIRERGLTIPCGALYSGKLAEPWAYAVRSGFQAIHPDARNLKIAGLTERCHESGIAVNVWTIDQPDQISLALRLGVDALITNVPDQALRIREQIAVPGVKP
ncbi:MAG TPA: glycerophosphodiester phosphodiesterase [Clostridiales bacterium]|nr:glycerophosphodiester phosphodiesterase [Clostridiales bacterium]